MSLHRFPLSKEAAGHGGYYADAHTAISSQYYFRTGGFTKNNSKAIKGTTMIAIRFAGSGKIETLMAPVHRPIIGLPQ